MVKRNFKIIFFTLNMMLLLTSCYTSTEKRYYSNKEVFIKDDGIIENVINLDKNDKGIVIWLKDVSEEYVYNDKGIVEFEIEGKNYDILMNSDAFEKISIGNEITFISAPGYIGDGYIRPIISLSVDGEELLSFEEGYKNLMDSYWYVFW